MRNEVSINLVFIFNFCISKCSTKIQIALNLYPLPIYIQFSFITTYSYKFFLMQNQQTTAQNNFLLQTSKTTATIAYSKQKRQQLNDTNILFHFSYTSLRVCENTQIWCVYKLCISACDEEIILNRIRVFTCVPVCICSYYVVKRTSTCHNCQNCNCKNSFQAIYSNQTDLYLCQIVFTNMSRESLLFYSSSLKSLNLLEMQKYII